MIARGDREAGSILLICPQGAHHNPKTPEKPLILEREPTFEGPGKWVAVATQHTDNEAKLSEYLTRRRASDPDLWILELDVADAERFAAEIITSA